MADQIFYPSIPAKKLKTDILSTDSTFRLRDIKWYTGSDAADVNLDSSIFGTGNVAYGCFEPNTARQEFFTFDPTNMATATTTGLTILLRGLPWGSDYATEATARKFNHPSGAVVLLFTNAPALYNTFANRTNDETITGVWTFSQAAAVPRLSAAHTYIAGEEEFLVTKRYADGLAIAGAPNATTTVQGLVELATQSQNNAGTATGETGASLAATPAINAVSIQNASWTYAADGGATDAYAITLTPAIGAYAVGQTFVFKANTANTGAATLNVSGLGAITIKKNHDQDLETGDIEAGSILAVTYDSTGPVFQMHTQQASMPTTALLTESATFFTNTDITGAEAETLSSGATSDADALHTHPDLLRSFTLFGINGGAGANFVGNGNRFAGYSDATTKTLAAKATGTALTFFQNINFEETISNVPYIGADSADVGGGVAHDGGCVLIGTNRWTQHFGGTDVYKDGSAVTISGTEPSAAGALGHDPTNSYLLVADSTTRVRRYSGIAGTTITFVDSITLDNAIENGVGFIYDNTNSRYIFLDSTVLRRFNSAGTTVDTVTLPAVLPTIHGLCFINNRVHLVSFSAIAIDDRNSTDGFNSFFVKFIPTNMTR